MDETRPDARKAATETRDGTGASAFHGAVDRIVRTLPRNLAADEYAASAWTAGCTLALDEISRGCADLAGEEPVDPGRSSVLMLAASIADRLRDDAWDMSQPTAGPVQNAIWRRRGQSALRSIQHMRRIDFHIITAHAWLEGMRSACHALQRQLRARRNQDDRRGQTWDATQDAALGTIDDMLLTLTAETSAWGLERPEEPGMMP